MLLPHPAVLFQAPHTKLTLNGAKSASTNGAILSYVWTIQPYTGDSSSSSSNALTAAADQSIITAVGPTAGLDAPPAGQYNVTLEVWDTEGGYAVGTTALSVDAANVLDWWSGTPGFAAPPAVAAPRPTAVLSVNGSRADTHVARAPTHGAAVAMLDGSGSGDGKGSRLAFFWAVTQTQPVTRQVDFVTSYVQPATLIHR